MHFSSTMTMAHLPTLLLLIGYPVYWIELYFLGHPTGHTTFLAALTFSGVAGVVIFRYFKSRWGGKAPVSSRWHFLWAAAVGVAVLILGMMLMASLLPVHLIQESDVLNYHITLPRQHLMLNSFAHLPWSSADLMFLPVDFALAPYWLVTELPNKYPQFLFFVALPFVVGSLVKRLGSDRERMWLAGLLVLSAHGIAIQGGTAMLDVVLCYLFVAALDSFLAGHVLLAAAEAAFFVFSKPGVPLMVLAVAGVVFLLWKTAGCRSWSWGFMPAPAGDSFCGARKFLTCFFMVAVCVGGPFLVKSAAYAGTPFYPLGAGLFSSGHGPASALRQQIDLRGQEHFAAKDNYGERSFQGFVSHFWMIAVPEKGVNNRFDYPLGLTWLLVLVPFVWLLHVALRSKNFPLLPVLCVVYWLFWWWTCQQSRFLFVPMVLAVVVVVVAIPHLSRVLWACVLAGLVLTAFSVYRAHAPGFGKKSYDVLREYDRQLLIRAVGVRPGHVVELDRPDAAFAPFVVDVKKEHAFFVLTP